MTSQGNDHGKCDDGNKQDVFVVVIVNVNVIIIVIIINIECTNECTVCYSAQFEKKGCCFKGA